MVIKLPQRGRPEGVRYRKCDMGTNLSAQFVCDIRGLDEHIYPIFHPYQILWDDMVNTYTGYNADPRYSICENSYKAGELVMGHILTDGKDVPVPDGHWHLWRYCEPANSWAHIINIDSTDALYLQLLVKRLWLQAAYNDKYGHRGYQKLMEQADIAKREKIQSDKNDMMNEISKANSAMLSRVRDNLEAGRVNSTNPTKEIIMSGAGMSNKSKIVRPLNDREGGLILPPGYDD
jgi:hypothetical protein